MTEFNKAEIVAAHARGTGDTGSPEVQVALLTARINALTGGESLDSNVELVLNNARLAAQIAVAYAALESEAVR